MTAVQAGGLSDSSLLDVCSKCQTGDRDWLVFPQDLLSIWYLTWLLLVQYFLLANKKISGLRLNIKISAVPGEGSGLLHMKSLISPPHCHGGLTNPPPTSDHGGTQHITAINCLQIIHIPSDWCRVLMSWSDSSPSSVIVQPKLVRIVVVRWRDDCGHRLMDFWWK